MSEHNRQPASHSLDSRRPTSLGDIVGNGDILQRFRNQVLQTGMPPRRSFLVGPSGAGKTTIGSILLYLFFCLRPRGNGDVCGLCTTCTDPNIRNHVDCEYWLGQELEQGWDNWWRDKRSYLLDPKSKYAFFLDEAQDLSERRQKGLYNILESANALIVFATTDRSRVLDALVNRFGSNVYELRRPTEEEILPFLRGHAERFGVTVSDAQLHRAIRHYDRDLRKCVDFIHTARVQNDGAVVTDGFMNSVCGSSGVAKQSKQRVTKL